MEACGTVSCAPPSPAWGGEIFSGAQQLQLSWSTTPDGVSFSLVTEASVEASVDLRLRPAVELIVRDDRTMLDKMQWHMQRGISVRVRYLDLFAAAASWVHRELFHPDQHGYVRAAGGPWRDEEERRQAKARASGTMQRVYQRLRELAVHAADCCEPVARAAVLRFCPHLRFRLYQRFVRDRSGRLLQLAAACPGALIFACALIEQQGAQAEVGERLLRRVRAGVRLPRLLDEAVEGWAATAGRGNGGWPASRAWLRLTEASAAEREQLLRQQRLLVRRAGPRVATTLLWLPPPLAFAPEDIPRATRANARWFQVMKEHVALLAPAAPEATATLRALSLFASRQAEGLHRASGRRYRVHRALGVLHDYLLATRQQPGRERNPATLLGEARRWHDRLHLPAAAEGAVAGAGAGALDPEAAAALLLPTLPDSGWVAPGVEVRPLCTALELAEEGGRMRHCVASRLSAALAGRSFLFHAVVRGARLTVELVQQSGRLYPGDVKGTANREPEREELALLQPWLTELLTRRGGAAFVLPPPAAPPDDGWLPDVDWPPDVGWRPDDEIPF